MLVIESHRHTAVSAPILLTLLFDLSPGEQFYVSNRTPVIQRKTEATGDFVNINRRAIDVFVAQRYDLAVDVPTPAQFHLFPCVADAGKSDGRIIVAAD